MYTVDTIWRSGMVPKEFKQEVMRPLIRKST